MQGVRGKVSNLAVLTGRSVTYDPVVELTSCSDVSFSRVDIVRQAFMLSLRSVSCGFRLTAADSSKTHQYQDTRYLRCGETSRC